MSGKVREGRAEAKPASSVRESAAGKLPEVALSKSPNPTDLPGVKQESKCGAL